MSQNVLAADVRSYFREDKSRQKGLSQAARHTLKPKQRGRIHPDARALYVEQTGNDYSEGNTSVYDLDGVQFSPVEARVALREAGVSFGKRGPLTTENLSKAASLLAGSAPVSK